MPVPTAHIAAKMDDFADTVLMPGDPLRSKFIAEKYLEDAVLINDIRGVNGYTGYYKGKRISVMASGMGQPSIGLYSYELFNFYDVKSIIRIGTCGSYSRELHAGDVVIALGSCTNSNYASQYKMPGTFCPIADFGLVRRAADYCEKIGINYKVGNVFSTDVYYNDSENETEWTKMGVLAVEMESAALYCNAARAGKKALCICSVSNSFVYSDEDTTPEQRITSFTSMMEAALEIAD